MVSLVTGKERTMSSADVAVMRAQQTGQGHSLIKLQPPTMVSGMTVASSYPVLVNTSTNTTADKDLVPSPISPELVATLCKPDRTETSTGTTTFVSVSDTGQKLGQYQHAEQDEHGQIVLQSSESVQSTGTTNNMVHVLVQASASGDEEMTAVAQTEDRQEAVVSQTYVVQDDRENGTAVLVQEKDLGNHLRPRYIF